MNAVLEGIYNGSIIFIGILIIWIYWAEYIYRWDPDRIGNLILQKYGPLNKSKITAGEYYNYSNVIVSADQTYATANIDIRDEQTQELRGSTPVKYKIDSQCGLIDLNCIAV